MCQCQVRWVAEDLTRVCVLSVGVREGPAVVDWCCALDPADTEAACWQGWCVQGWLACDSV